MRVLCAPNAFKGTLRAEAAAAALAAGVLDAGGEAVRLPMADGGDGTLDVLLAASSSARTARHRVSGPLGGRVVARLGWDGPASAIVELAEAAGMRRLTGRLAPLRATSRGAGDLISAALDGGAGRVTIGVGGSACTDGGAGIIVALGGRLLDRRGRPIPSGGAALASLAAADLSGLDPRLGRCRLEVAVDVDNPLLGERGAARVFAPQKGATPAQVAELEANLCRLAEVLERDAGLPVSLRRARGAGAAGGCGYGLSALGATLAPGAALVAGAVGLDEALSDCDLVITGEGRLDAQTGGGKAPMEVAVRAAAAGVACVVVAGVVDSIPPGFSRAISLQSLARPGEDPQRVPRRLLRRAGRLLGAPALAAPRG